MLNDPREELTSAHVARRNESESKCHTSMASTSPAEMEMLEVEEYSSDRPLAACFQLRK